MREPNLGSLLWVSIASVGPSWHVGFTPDFGRIAARQKTDAPGQQQTFSCGHHIEESSPELALFPVLLR
jgi:hypothetical protein